MGAMRAWRRGGEGSVDVRRDEMDVSVSRGVVEGEGEMNGSCSLWRIISRADAEEGREVMSLERVNAAALR
jgi:hypothetical protein